MIKSASSLKNLTMARIAPQVPVCDKTLLCYITFVII
jgi:hypothetical protein